MKIVFCAVMFAGALLGQFTPPPSGGGTGTVTSVATSCGVSGGPITTTGTVSDSIVTAAHNGSYAILTGDCGKSLTTNTAAAWTIAQAGTTGFEAGKYWIVNNVGAGSLTVTATTSTFYGGPSANISGSVLTVPTFTSATIISDGTNYQVLSGAGGGTIPSTTSALRGDGAGNAAAVTGTGSNCVLVNGTSAACSGVAGASTALDNLAAVSINTSLLAQTGVDAGSTTKPFRDLFLWGSGTFGTTYIRQTAAPTGARIWTWQDTTDTVVGRATTDNLTNKTLTSPVLVTPALGTPASGVATNITGLPLTAGVTGILPSANGGTGINNTATLTLGSSNQNWATLGTGIVKNTTTTGAITNAISSDVYGLWSGSCSSATFLRGDGACASASANPSLSALTAATGSNTIANSTNGQIWNWALAGSQTGFTFGETTAATGTGNTILALNMLAGSTAIPFNILFPSIGVTTTDGILLSNATAAAAGAQQWSPRLKFSGFGWKTTATAASVAASFAEELQPQQSSSAPQSILAFTAAIAGSTTKSLSLCYAPAGQAGVVISGLDGAGVSAAGCDGNIAGWAGIGPAPTAAGSIFSFWTNGVARESISNNGVIMAAASGVIWASTTLSNQSTGDVSNCRDAAGVLSVYNGTACGTTAANYRVLKASAVAAGGTTFTASGLSVGTPAGGATAGTVAIGANGPGTVVVTMGNSATATTGWNCTVYDSTTLTVLLTKASSTTTTFSVSVPAGALSGDVLNVGPCVAY